MTHTSETRMFHMSMFELEGRLLTLDEPQRPRQGMPPDIRTAVTVVDDVGSARKVVLRRVDVMLPIHRSPVFMRAEVKLTPLAYDRCQAQISLQSVPTERLVSFAVSMTVLSCASLVVSAAPLVLLPVVLLYLWAYARITTFQHNHLQDAINSVLAHDHYDVIQSAP